MHRAQDFQGPFRIRDRRLEQRRLIRATPALCVARTGIPSSRYDALVILDGLILDLDPVAEKSAWSFEQPITASRCRPGARIPSFSVMNSQISRVHVLPQLLQPADHVIGKQLCFERTRRDAAQS